MISFIDDAEERRLARGCAEGDGRSTGAGLLLAAGVALAAAFVLANVSPQDPDEARIEQVRRIANVR